MNKKQWWLKFNLDNISENDIIIDCGANIGEFAQFLYKRKCIIHAFEPHPILYQNLIKKFERKNNIIIYPYGVYDQEGEFLLYLPQDTTKDLRGCSLFKNKININQNNSIQVKTIDFSKFIFGLNKPVKLVKMNIEGSEIPVLTHLIKTNAISLIEQTIVDTHVNKITSSTHQMKQLQEIIKQSKIQSIHFYT